MINIQQVKLFWTPICAPICRPLVSTQLMWFGGARVTCIILLSNRSANDNVVKIKQVFDISIFVLATRRK